jgi:hypothetical protein
MKFYALPPSIGFTRACRTSLQSFQFSGAELVKHSGVHNLGDS